MGPKDPNWKDRAACQKEDPDLFFNMSGDFPVIVARLRKICNGCPVKNDCRRYIDGEERGRPVAHWHGFWSGETVKERKARRDAAKAALEARKQEQGE